MGRRISAFLVAATLVLAITFGAAVAAADSIVFVKDENVWLIRPDGSGLEQVTSSGSPADPYTAVSQADDGTIVAARGNSGGRDVLVRMSRDGQMLNSFRPSLELEYPMSGIDDVAVSPNGNRIAYTTGFNGNGDCSESGFEVYCYFLGVATVTGKPLGFVTFAASPAWIGNDRLMVSLPNGTTGTYDIGDEEVVEWFPGPGSADGDAPDFLYGGDITRAGDRIATVSRDFDLPMEPGYQSRNALYTWKANGPPPGIPSIECRLGPVPADFGKPGWSPDGSGLSFEIHTVETPIGKEGVWVYRWDRSDCSSFTGQRIVPDGYSPDWGPADVRPVPGRRFRLYVSVRGSRPVGNLTVTVRCTRSCRVSAGGTIRLGKRVFGLKPVSARLPAGVRRKLKLRPARARDSGRIARLLHRPGIRRRAKALIGVTGHGPGRSTDRHRVAVQLVSPRSREGRPPNDE